MTPEQVVAGVREGRRRAIGRAITMAESLGPEGRAVMRALHPRAGRAMRVGITGSPGAGKSTLLRAVAGLERVGSGSLELAGAVVDPVPYQPAEERSVGLVHQGAHLFPHLTAQANVAFPLRAAGLPRTEANERARAMLERVGAASLAKRRAPTLSGGEAARVALARALARARGQGSCIRAVTKPCARRRRAPGASCGRLSDGAVLCLRDPDCAPLCV